MRKGRSQRRGRGSLAPISQKALQPLGGGMQIVVGLKGPPPGDASSYDDEPSSSGSLRTEAPVRPSLDLVPERSLDLVPEKSLELASVEEEVAVAVAPSEEPLPVTLSVTTPQEISIPPASDLAIEPVAEKFFSEGDFAPSSAGGEEEEWETTGPASKAKQKASPEAVARRARFSRWVSLAVAGAALLCVAGLARSVVKSPPPPAAPVTAALVAAPAEKAAAPAAADPANVATAKIAAAPATEAAHVAAPIDTANVAVAPAAESPKPAEPAKDEAKPVSDKTALQEKTACRRALERGKLADAIEAGERSVALDPTDGEAWLLLGASYQEKGKGADARRCYRACAEQGKRGPVGECRAMLR